MRLCPCHGEPMRYRSSRGRTFWACIVKVRAKNKLAAQRYRATVKGQARVARNNDRRIWAGMDFLGRGVTPEQTATITAILRQRLTAFHAHQQKARDGFIARLESGTESQGSPVVEVPIEAAAGGD